MEAFSNFFELESNKVKPDSIIEESNQMVQDEFNLKYGWLMIAKSVEDFKNTTFDIVLQENVYYVLTIAQLLKEQVELIQLQTPTYAS